jgi:hypothetical protein
MVVTVARPILGMVTMALTDTVAKVIAMILFELGQFLKGILPFVLEGGLGPDGKDGAVIIRDDQGGLAKLYHLLGEPEISRAARQGYHLVPYVE